MFGTNKNQTTPFSGFERYRDFLNDLAVVYPEITQEVDFIYYASENFVPVHYRVEDIRMAAEAIRTAENQKRADALVKEFRKGNARAAT